jgi:glycerol kinase
MAFLMALDQGTTSSRAIIFDDGGAIVASAQQEFRQHYPQPGWVEHDPVEIWETQIGVATLAMKNAGLGSGDIAAIGITNQRETTVVWERATGRPICNAIVWQDRRTAAVCDRLRADGHEPLIRNKTGLVPDAGTPGLRHDRFMADLESDRRGNAYHRLLQRLPDDALQHPYGRLG